MNTANSSIVIIKDINFRYSKHMPFILKEINVFIERGTATAITGESGCGKSTLAHILCGIIPMGIQGELTGEVLIEQRPINNLKLPELSQKIGIVFQDVDCQLFMPTVEEELAFAPENLCLSKAEIKRRIDNTLKLLEIENIRYQNPHTLSGGQKRLAAIGAVMTMNPDILIMDEPFSELDQQNVLLISRVLENLKKDNKTIIIIEHNPDYLKQADYLYYIKNGSISMRMKGVEIDEFLQTGFCELFLS